MTLFKCVLRAFKPRNSFYNNLRKYSVFDAYGSDDVLLEVMSEVAEDKGVLSADVETHSELMDEYQLKAAGLQNLFVIQPYLWSENDATAKDRSKQSSHRKMSETLALVDTLGWNAVGQKEVGLKSFMKREFFGSGKMQELQEAMDSSPLPITSVLVSAYQLSQYQRLNLEQEFQRPVIDRYNLILQIFHLHARTREAKLQVALAEIPYIKQRLVQDRLIENDSKHSKSLRRGESYFERRDMMLKRREKQLKTALNKIKKQRAVIRKNRMNLGIPSVAVVGYTNCGKTSLIKALSGSESLAPRNQLFATLDVTVHECRLPSNLKSLFVDTVGFISDIPTSLIASFSATLEDAALADLLIHVRDVSNPDHEAQSQQVLRTLKSLKIPENLIDNMITLGNKIDLVPPSEWKAFNNAEYTPISVVEGFGLDYVVQKVEKSLFEATGRKRAKVRVKTSSDEFRWLHDNVTVSEVVPDEADPNYSLVSVVMSEAEVGRLKKMVQNG